MAQDKRNFTGGLNRDDDSRVVPNGDYHNAQNIRVLSSEGRNTMLVENIRGTQKHAYNRVFGGREGAFGSDTAEYRVIGSYEDAPNNCLYYFIWNEKNFHMILEYNNNTETISTVFRDTGLPYDSVLNFDKNTLITGINKIGDLLYWTCDNTFLSNTGETIHNEPKYINVEKGKAGFTIYYDGGDYSLGTPGTAFDIDTQYPYEFYVSDMDNNPNNAFVPAFRKRLYIDVCKKRPNPPIYFHQTPVKNITNAQISSIPFTTLNGESSTFNLAANTISTNNVSVDTIESTSGLEIAYKKNNLYGFVWQFAYRYVYKDNEVGSYSEWSYTLPNPTYYSNDINKEKQRQYNQLRVWYWNGPADVSKIEIVARKCSYIETAPDEGNKGEYYLIASVDNNYYDANYTFADDDYTGIGEAQYEYTNVTTENVPYIKSMTTGSVDYSATPLGYIDFRNDGVYTAVDPVEFNKLYDRVPKRAKAQDIIAENRISYGNYIDGFNGVPVKFDLVSLYGGVTDPIVISPTGNSQGGATYDFGGGDITTEQMDELGISEENIGSAPTIKHSINGALTNNQDNNLSDAALCWNADAAQSKVTYTFPTEVEVGQTFFLKFNFRVKYKVNWGNLFVNTASHWPHVDWGDSWDPYNTYEYFGVQINLKKEVTAGGISTLLNSFITDIQAVCAGTYVDNTGNNNPDSEDFNENVGLSLNHLYREDADGNQSYLGSDEQKAAEMRFVGATVVDNNKLEIVFSPYGQETANGGCNEGQPNNENSSTLPDNDFQSCNGCTSYTMLDGTTTTNLHVWYMDGDFMDATNCGLGGCGTYTPGGLESRGCFETGSRCKNSLEYITPNNTEDGLVTTGSGTDIITGTETPWSDFEDTNISFDSTIDYSQKASGFKSGSWHRFGLVYYDGKGRSSTVLLEEGNKSDPSRSSSVYVKFPPEKKFIESLDGISSTELTNDQKLVPGRIGWKVYHKPPIWSRYYHWVYARNTSVGKFMQFTVDKAYINMGAKPGTSAADSDADTKIYISLNTMDGRVWSYSEKNRSLIGDWSFAEGDRMRVITNNSGSVMADPDDATTQRYYDFKLSDVGSFPTRFDYDTNTNDNDDGSDNDNVSNKIRASVTSPVGGTQGNPQKGKHGKFLVIDDQGISGMDVSSANTTEAGQGEIANWSGCIIEIYRPKKNTNPDQVIYYEFSERYAIGNKGLETRYHQGSTQNQDPTGYSVADGIDQSTVPATGIFKRGDIWFKPRKTRSIDEGNTSTNIIGYYESYFLNDFMQTNHNNIGRPHLYSPNAVEQRREATITYSDVFQPDTKYNGFHSFPFSQRPYMDYDLNQGSIQKLISRNTDLLVLQEDKVSTVLVGKDIITSPSGDAGISLSKNVLSNTASPLAGNWGVATNPESVAVYGKTVYFCDIKRGAVLRIGGDGLTPISEYKMVDFFRDKMDEYQAITEDAYNDKLNGPLKILGGYDPRHGEYVVTFPDVYAITTGTDNQQKNKFNRCAVNFNSLSQNFETNVFKDKRADSVYDDDATLRVKDNGQEVLIEGVTIGFNEKNNRWSSFYTYYPDYYGKLHRTFVSFKWGNLYKHDMDSNNHCLFYDNPYPDEMKLGFAFNGDVSSVKGWNNVSIEGIDRQEVIPIKGESISVSTSSTTVTGTGTTFTDNDIEVGDTLYYYTSNNALGTIGTVDTVTNDTSITLSANSLVANTALVGAFIITTNKTLYLTKMITNINDTQVTHRTSYNNDSQTGNSQVAGSWVMREDIGSVKIPYGTTNTVGGEYFGLGNCSTNNSSTALRGNTLADGSGDSTNTTFTTAGINVGDSIFYNNSGTETLIGVISAITDNDDIVLVANASTSLANTFMFVKKTAQIEGDRMKGHFMDTELTKRTKDKVHIFAINANVNKSELSNK